jgi:hypothetical protein
VSDYEKCQFKQSGPKLATLPILTLKSSTSDQHRCGNVARRTTAVSGTCPLAGSYLPASNETVILDSILSLHFLSIPCATASPSPPAPKNSLRCVTLSAWWTSTKNCSRPVTTSHRPRRSPLRGYPLQEPENSPECAGDSSQAGRSQARSSRSSPMPVRDGRNEALVPHRVQEASMHHSGLWVLRVEGGRKGEVPILHPHENRPYAVRRVMGAMGKSRWSGRVRGDSDDILELAGRRFAGPNAVHTLAGPVHSVARSERTECGWADAVTSTIPTRADGDVAGRSPGELSEEWERCRVDRAGCVKDHAMTQFQLLDLTQVGHRNRIGYFFLREEERLWFCPMLFYVDRWGKCGSNTCRSERGDSRGCHF